MLKKISVPFLGILLFSLPVMAAETHAAEFQNGRFQSLMIQAVGRSFDLDEDGADVLLKKAIALEPENPMGYALEAMLHIVAYESCFTLE